MEPDGQLALYEAVAAGLKEAHRKVREVAATDAERAELTRRLLAITGAAKHDLAGAARRLERLRRELDARS
ncbi:hypothetical protein [Streptomyces phytophilus]|uniref:hypothetical protein n=1 Tax=Streptomyces phytophilus TaxID=722715 RepID=UPI0015EFF417|nr:hypothetical protein [Streptomyces phytophilus]